MVLIHAGDDPKRRPASAGQAESHGKYPCVLHRDPIAGKGVGEPVGYETKLDYAESQTGAAPHHGKEDAFRQQLLRDPHSPRMTFETRHKLLQCSQRPGLCTARRW